MDGIHKTLQDLNIQQNPKLVSYDEKAAFLCMKNYLQLFYERIPFEGIGNILSIINQIIPQSNSVSWNHWLACINAAIEQEFTILG